MIQYESHHFLCLVFDGPKITQKMIIIGGGWATAKVAHKDMPTNNAWNHQKFRKKKA